MYTSAILASYPAFVMYSHSNAGDTDGKNNMCIWNEKENRDILMRFVMIMGHEPVFPIELHDQTNQRLEKESHAVRQLSIFLQCLCCVSVYCIGAKALAHSIYELYKTAWWLELQHQTTKNSAGLFMKKQGSQAQQCAQG